MHRQPLKYDIIFGQCKRPTGNLGKLELLRNILFHVSARRFDFVWKCSFFCIGFDLSGFTVSKSEPKSKSRKEI